MVLKDLLPPSQEPATSPYPEPDQFSPCPLIPVPECYPPICACVSKLSLSLSSSPLKPCMHFSHPSKCYMLHPFHSSWF